MRKFPMHYGHEANKNITNCMLEVEKPCKNTHDAPYFFAESRVQQRLKLYINSNYYEYC